MPLNVHIKSSCKVESDMYSGLPQCQDFSWQKAKLCVCVWGGGGVSINSIYYVIFS